jgi:hypothetical protein
MHVRRLNRLWRTGEAKKANLAPLQKQRLHLPDIPAIYQLDKMTSNNEDSSFPAAHQKEGHAVHLEMSQKGDPVDSELDLSPEEHGKTFRKVDFRLMPMLMALYLIANLDR